MNMYVTRIVLLIFFYVHAMGLSFAEEPLSTTNPYGLSLTSEEQTWLDEHPVIRVASDPDYAPFQFTNDAGKSEGIANDFLEVIAERLGVRFEYLLSDSWAQTLQLMKDKKADMLSSAAKTPEREAYLRFSEPYVDFPDVIITRAGQDFPSLESLSGKYLVTLDGTAINEFLQQNYPDINLVLVKDVRGLLQRVSTGEVDAGVLNLATTSYAVKKWKITNLRISNRTDFSYKLALASRRDWPMLSQILGKALATITEEERQQVFQKWITISSPSDNKKVKKILLTQKEREWLDKHPVILAAADPDWPPMEFLNREGRSDGISADYLALIEERLGIRIDVVPQENWSQALQSVRERKTAILAAAASTPDRSQYMNFTQPYLELPAAIIVNNNTHDISAMEDLEGRKVAVVKDYGTHDYLERYHSKVDLLPVADISSGLYSLFFGEVDAFIVNVASASYYIEKLAIQNLRVVGESGYVYKLTMASRSDWPILNGLLQKSIDSISNEERQSIYRKWVALKAEPWRPTREQIIGLVVTLIIIGFGVTLIWNRQLRKTVEFRTQELRVSEEAARAARETAEMANRAKTEFLAAASHDLRQPLHAMNLQIEMLKASLQDEKSEEILAQISDSQFALSETLNALLDVSHLDAGNLKPNHSHFQLQQLFVRLESEFTSLARKQGIKLRFRATLAWLYSDTALLYRVLANLVDNAVKHSHAAGVLIAARKRGDNWCIEVWDCGPGIPEEHKKIIFDKFVQLDSPGRDKNKGLGLGLAIVQRLVQLLDLQLSVHSHVGYGSCFKLTVPEGKPRPKQSGEPLSHKERGYHLQGTVVLVVDDDPNVLNSTRDLLNSWHCAVITAASMEEAVAETADEDVDIIIADYRLGNGSTGLDVIEALNKQNEKNGNRKSKVVIITGDVNPSNVSSLRECDYPILNKPVIPITLRSTLHKLMMDVEHN